MFLTVFSTHRLEGTLLSSHCPSLALLGLLFLRRLIEQNRVSSLLLQFQCVLFQTRRRVCKLHGILLPLADGCRIVLFPILDRSHCRNPNVHSCSPRDFYSRFLFKIGAYKSPGY